MLGILVIAVVIIILLAILVKPKLGVVLLWPALFMYPHYYMWQRQLLPLNIGIDDLFICTLFIIVLVRRNLMEGVRPRLGYAFWSTFIFFIIVLIGNINGYLLVRAESAEFAKKMLKGALSVLLAYSLLNCIDDLDDLKRVVFSFCFFAGVGAVIMIMQQLSPGPFSIFASPHYVERLQAGINPAPAGAFMNRNNAALILGVASLIIVNTHRLGSQYFRKNLRFVLLGIMVIAVLFTRSRSGFLCLVIPLTMMSFLSGNKGYAMLLLIAGLTIFMVLPAFRTALFERFGTGGTAEENIGFWAPILGRYKAVFEVWGNVTLRRLIFGQSGIADLILGWPIAHSAYLGIPLIYGIGGAIWAMTFFTIMYRKAKTMKRHYDITIASLGSGVSWCLLVFAAVGVAGLVLGNLYIRYTLFLLAVVVQRGTELTWQYQMWDYDELYMDNPDSIALSEEYVNADCGEVDSDWS